MRKNLTGLAVLLGIAGGLQVSGCVVLPPITQQLPLGSSGTFEVEAGVPKVNTFSYGGFDAQGATFRTGSFKINPSAITVTPGGTSGKGAVNLQANTLTVEVRIAGAGEESTVCESGELYGPFSVELDENYNVVSIDPSSVTLKPSTVSLLNEGAVVLCITVEASFDGVVSISQFELTVSVQLG